MLNAVGILTVAGLVKANPGRLRAMLGAAGSRFRMHDRETWPEQAWLTAAARWEEPDRLEEERKGDLRE